MSSEFQQPDEKKNCSNISGIRFVDYQDESQLDYVMSLVGRDLSEPYSIFTYRYFLARFPQLCILAMPEDGGEPIGCVVGKIDEEETTAAASSPPGDAAHDVSVSKLPPPAVPLSAAPSVLTGYIGMLAVQTSYRRQGIGKALVRECLRRMKEAGCSSATLETEVSNVTAQQLYENIFGFIREELLVRYYLNFNDAYRLRLWF